MDSRILPKMTFLANGHHYETQEDAWVAVSKDDIITMLKPRIIEASINNLLATLRDRKEFRYAIVNHIAALTMHEDMTMDKKEDPARPYEESEESGQDFQAMMMAITGFDPMEDLKAKEFAKKFNEVEEEYTPPRDVTGE